MPWDVADVATQGFNRVGCIGRRVRSYLTHGELNGAQNQTRRGRAEGRAASCRESWRSLSGRRVLTMGNVTVMVMDTDGVVTVVLLQNDVVVIIVIAVAFAIKSQDVVVIVVVAY